MGHFLIHCSCLLGKSNTCCRLQIQEEPRITDNQVDGPLMSGKTDHVLSIGALEEAYPSYGGPSDEFTVL